MSEWLNYKGLGPWEFIPQPDKPHYNEGNLISDAPILPGGSPIWQFPLVPAAIPVTPREHDPWCGYWYKGATLSTTSRVLVAPMYQDGSAAENGVGIAIYSPDTEAWTYGGVALGDGAPGLGQPHTGRINSSFVAYYGDWDGLDSSYSMRLNVFQNGSLLRHVDLWTYAKDVCDFNRNNCKDMMDCNADGVIACITYLVEDGGETKNAWGIKVSTDIGETWGDTYYFPALTAGGYLGASVRLDDSGNIWVAIMSSAYYGAGENAYIIYKSTDNGASFTEICKTALSADIPTLIAYTIDHTGQYQYLSMTFIDYDVDDNAMAMFKSSDYGATWTATQAMVFLTDSILHSSNQTNVIRAYYPGTNTFKVSNDSAASFSEVTPPSALTDQYADIQNCKEIAVYTECGKFFGGSTLGALLSLDNGATWSVINIPATGDFDQPVFISGWQQSVDAIIY